MFAAAASDIPAGHKYRIARNNSELSFRQLFELLSSSDEFADWFSNTLAAFETTAFYWELPPLTVSAVDDASEFVLIDAPFLSKLPPDPRPFAPQFQKVPDQDVAIFENIGGDAVLVAPCPHGPAESYPHLAAFLRDGKKSQVRAFWQKAAETLLDRLSDTPIWLSTAGLGVAWLHLRLDTVPKYYSYRPYADMG